MTRLTFFILLVAAVFCSCSDRTTIQNVKTNFKIFEISFTDGWTSSFSFIADTNKIYFVPRRADTAYYGILPVEISNLLDTTVATIKYEKNIKSNDGDCIDCPALAIRIVSDGDTIRINQFGYLDTLFYPVIEALRDFIDKGEHQKIQAIVLLETKSVVIPPPLYIEEIKFTVPE